MTKSSPVRRRRLSQAPTLPVRVTLAPTSRSSDRPGRFISCTSVAGRRPPRGRAGTRRPRSTGASAPRVDGSPDPGVGNQERVLERAGRPPRHTAVGAARPPPPPGIELARFPSSSTQPTNAPTRGGRRAGPCPVRPVSSASVRPRPRADARQAFTKWNGIPNSTWASSVATQGPLARPRPTRQSRVHGTTGADARPPRAARTSPHLVGDHLSRTASLLGVRSRPGF